MNTYITEDYVSFEVAKLLKEKGFGELTCGFYYDNYTEELIVSSPSNHNGSINSIAAPSQAQAMKWLREEKEIAIEILMNGVGEWYCDLYNTKTLNHYTEMDYVKSYEEACEAAIKYCLTNLI